jgi:hypothetical protein
MVTLCGCVLKKTLPFELKVILLKMFVAMKISLVVVFSPYPWYPFGTWIGRRNQGPRLVLPVTDWGCVYGLSVNPFFLFND